MTQQDDITQRVLTDDEIRAVWVEHGLDDEAVEDFARAIESAVLSKLLAPVADERQAVAYLDLGTGGYMDMDTDLTDEELSALPKGRHMLAIIGTHSVNGYTPVSAPIADERAVETFAERFALALKPVAYTTKRGAVYLGKSTQVGSENLCTISQAVYEFRAALASAPVAGEAIYYAVMHGNALYGIFDTETAAEACKAQGHPDAPFSVKPLYAAPQASAEHWQSHDRGLLSRVPERAQADKDGGQQLRWRVTDDMRYAVRFAPSSAHWSERLKEFFGPDAREGIDALERQLREAHAMLDRQPKLRADASAVRRALIAASNYIDTLGGDSKSYRAALSATQAEQGERDAG